MKRRLRWAGYSDGSPRLTLLVVKEDGEVVERTPVLVLPIRRPKNEPQGAA